MGGGRNGGEELSSRSAEGPLGGLGPVIAPVRCLPCPHPPKPQVSTTRSGSLQPVLILPWTFSCPLKGCRGQCLQLPGPTLGLYLLSKHRWSPALSPLCSAGRSALVTADRKQLPLHRLRTPDSQPAETLEAPPAPHSAKVLGSRLRAPVPALS